MGKGKGKMSGWKSWCRDVKYGGAKRISISFVACESELWKWRHPGVHRFL
jgi:hypothetical protein